MNAINHKTDPHSLFEMNMVLHTGNVGDMRAEVAVSDEIPRHTAWQYAERSLRQALMPAIVWADWQRGAPA